MSVVIDGTNGITAPGVETFGNGTAIGGTTNPIVAMTGASTNYVQAYAVNNTNGTSSSADLVAYPSNGNDSHGWVDMGITSLAYADSTYTITGPNESYLFGSGPTGTTGTGNLVIATDNTGTANDIQFYTGGFTQAKSAAKMVIQNSTGNVGVGTVSPSFKLDVQGIVSRVGGATSGSAIAYTQYGSSATDLNNYILGCETGSLAFYQGKYGGTSTERARIDSSGNLLVGTTSFSTTNGGLISNYNSGTSTHYIGHISGSSGGSGYAVFQYNGGAIGSITQNGTTGVLYNLTSDYRLKNNPQPLTGAKEFVMALQPKKWQWWDGSGEGVGFIAHEFMEVAKYSGHGEKDAVDADGKPVYQSIQPSSSEVMANLIALVQEQQALITDMAAKLKAAGVQGF